MMNLFFICSVHCLILLYLRHISANVEVDALNALKTNLEDPNGVLQSWNPALLNPCTWFNITCNHNNRVTRLDLQNANLTGRLVDKLGALEALEYLELQSNNITGIIPNELGNLTNLESLNLARNNLNGPIPTNFGNLQKLRFLQLNNNNLSGNIPVSLTTITSLQILDLSNNRLTGNIPVNGSFSQFSPISFTNNSLDGLPAHAPPILTFPPSSPGVVLQVCFLAWVWVLTFLSHL